MNHRLKGIEIQKNQHQLPNRTTYIPYMSRHVFALPYIKFLSHAVTPLNQQWHCQMEENIYHHEYMDVDTLFHKREDCYLKCTRTFMIDDFDYSKDYHLNIEGAQQPFIIYLNESYVGTVEGSRARIEFDVTHAVHEAKNVIELVATEMSDDDTTLHHMVPFQEMYVLERANDRIVDYTVDVSRHARGDLSVRIQIQDIEGAPVISYLLENEQHMTFAKGTMDMDSCYHLLIPAHLVGQQGRHFTLFLETEDETIAHYIDFNGEHEPVNVKTV
ncbi:sugar-binding domain-containing protein [Staphylococcus cornubiensis]|uniref:sugar-binding domain-containing protein n=1 Tax=Staphylococcus cornubiensis TaxID=1986155 RepID=UPI000A35DA8F|nr:sugar-binding domain-containing protein [Staphylococcus cornubiensis]